MLSQLFSAPLEKIRSYISRPAPPAESGTKAASPQHPPGGSFRRARAVSTASSVTLGPTPPSPQPMTPTQPSQLASLTHQSDLIANFWGGGRSQGLQVRPAPKETPRPPPGLRRTTVDTLELEDMKAPKEPRTLARTCFLWGFLLPFLWAVGLVLLFFPTKYEPDLERAPVGSAEEMQRHKAAYRAAEEKWAQRCLWAFMTLLGAIAVIVITVILAMKGM